MRSRVWSILLLSVLSLTGLTGCQWLPEVGNVKLSDSAISITVGTQRTITARVEPDVADYDGIVWTSSNPKVASVVDGTITGVRDGVTQITATAAGVTSSPCSVTVKSIRVSSVSISKTSTELIAGQATKLEAAINPSDATNQTLFWSTSDSYVATVTSDGLVVSKNPGIATITVRSDDGDHTATCQVTVKPKVIDVTGITLSQSSVSVKEEAIVQLKATVKPSNATNQEVSWSSGDEGIVTVASDGTVTGVTEGTTTITAKSADGKVTATCKVTVTAEYVDIPDPNFRKYIIDTFDLNRNGKLSLTEAAVITRIEVVTDNIKSLQGIEYMSALTYLFAGPSAHGSGQGQLTSLNLSNNKALKYLDCRSNQLNSLNVTHNSNLKEFKCWNNKLEVLDVSANTALEILECDSNLLSDLDVSHNTQLKELRCSNNQISSLILSNAKLTNLGCSSNPLTSLLIIDCPSLEELWCENTPLATINVSSNSRLKWLSVQESRITKLDISNNLELEYLWVTYNMLSKLDVSNNTKLRSLNCYSNGLTVLDLSNNAALEQLSCGSNRLTVLDVSKNKSLTDLNCSPMSTLKTLYVSSGQSIEGVTVNRSTDRVPSGTSIKTK